MTTDEIAVLFVCLGNICRSPTAHSVFEKMVFKQGLNRQIRVDSAGTGDWHIGKQPDSRAIEVGQQRGYKLSHLRARLVTATDFKEFDYILAMDSHNLANLEQIKPCVFDGTLSLFLPFGQAPFKQNWQNEVPDPYSGGAEGFERVLDMVERASAGLLAHVCEKHFPSVDFQPVHLGTGTVD